MALRRLWTRWTTPTAEGPQARRKDAVLLSCLAALVVASGITQVVQLLSVAITGSLRVLGWWGVNLGLALGASGLLRLARGGRRRLAATALSCALMGLSVVLLLADGTRSPTWPLLLALAVVLATILVGALPAIGLGATAVLLVVPIWALQRTGTLRPLWRIDPRTGTNAGGVAGVLLLIAVLVYVLWVYTREVFESVDEVLTRGSATSPLRQLRTRRLSLRELDVVRLVAEGHSNPDIARELFLSARTVQTHVANAMRKTSCANRTELGVLAVREGLVPFDPEAAAAAAAAE